MPTWKAPSLIVHFVAYITLQKIVQYTIFYSKQASFLLQPILFSSKLVCRSGPVFPTLQIPTIPPCFTLETFTCKRSQNAYQYRMCTWKIIINLSLSVLIFSVLWWRLLLCGITNCTFIVLICIILLTSSPQLPLRHGKRILMSKGFFLIGCLFIDLDHLGRTFFTSNVHHCGFSGWHKIIKIWPAI